MKCYQYSAYKGSEFVSEGNFCAANDVTAEAKLFAAIGPLQDTTLVAKLVESFVYNEQKSN